MEIKKKKKHHHQNPPVYKSHLIQGPEASELLTKVGAKTFYNFGSKVKVLVILICAFVYFL